MDINQIKELVKVVKESGVGEIVVEEEGSRVAVRMPGVSFAPATQNIDASDISSSTNDSDNAASPKVPDLSSGNSTDSKHSGWYEVKAPMVGTFYEAPAPGEEPFVSVGSEVCAGDTLCIVEAMKLMNEICAEELGVVKEVCVKDSTPVEFGQTLFWIEPKSNMEGTATDTLSDNGAVQQMDSLNEEE